MKNRKQLYYIIFIVISIIAFSCSTKEINDYYYRYLKSEKLFKVSFIANVAAYTQQDALPEDRIITMYTYDNDGNYYATNNYRTDKPGIPTPINSSGLEVPTGVYNFYALSIENNSGYPPSLDNSNYISDLDRKSVV